MRRRQFLKRAALVGGSAAAGAAVAVGVEEPRVDAVRTAAHAVGGSVPERGSCLVAYRVNTTEPVLALTFDDGPSTQNTNRVLDILERKDAHATFFVVGRNIASRSAVLRRAAQGNEIGNHTWNHADLSTAQADAVQDQLDRTHDAIKDATGTAPVLFRPPYGRFGGAVVLEAASHGYSMVLWSERVPARGESVHDIVRHLGNAPPGSIVLAHDGGTLPTNLMLDALPDLIDRWQSRGLRLVTVSDLLRHSTPPRR